MKNSKRLAPVITKEMSKFEERKKIGEFVAKQVIQNRVCTIRYVCEFLDVSRDWLVKNIMPNVPNWKFLDRYLLAYHRYLEPLKDIQFTTAKMHDLIDIKYAEREEDTVMKKFDNGRILFSIEEVIEYINNNCKCTRQTALINIYDLMTNNEIDYLNSNIKVKDKQEIIDDVLKKNDTEELNPQKRKITSNKKKIEHININFDLTKINIEKLKDNLLTPKKIHKLTEMSYRHAFRNCYIKIEFNSDRKTWFYPVEHYFEKNNAENYYPILISYEDFLRLKDENLLKI